MLLRTRMQLILTTWMNNLGHIEGRRLLCEERLKFTSRVIHNSNKADMHSAGSGERVLIDEFELVLIRKLLPQTRKAGRFQGPPTKVYVKRFG